MKMYLHVNPAHIAIKTSYSWIKSISSFVFFLLWVYFQAGEELYSVIYVHVLRISLFLCTMSFTRSKLQPSKQDKSAASRIAAESKKFKSAEFVASDEESASGKEGEDEEEDEEEEDGEGIQ